MKSGTVKTSTTTAALALLSIAMGAPAFAASYNLTAAPFTATLPDQQTVTMWGYCLTPISGTCTPSMQAPALVADDGSLTINLTNKLPESTSIVIPGLQTTFNPIYFTDPAGRQRAKSFVAEAGATNGTATYTWSVKPGTYLYHSGSHPGIQVQMGLYGAVSAHAPGGAAYAGITFGSEVVLLYSEIDKCLHDAVSTGVYGSATAAAPASCGPNQLPLQLPNQQFLAAPTAPTSPMYYAPTYYMVNGGNLPTINPTSAPVLLRLLNAGNKTHIPELINGGYLKLVAEDGNPYQYPQSQYSVFLPAGKTMDAIWTPPAAGVYGLFDKSGNNNSATAGGSEVPGGMMVELSVGSGRPLAVATADSYTTTAGVTLTTTAATGVMANDINVTGGSAKLGTTTTHGILTLNVDGSFTYVPTNSTYTGTDTFTYYDTVGANNSNIATVTITITAPPPAAVNDSATTPQSTPVTINVLTNDTNSAGVLTTSLVITNLTQPSLIDGFGSVGTNATQTQVIYTPPSVPDPAFANPVTFTYEARDTVTNLVSQPATVSVTVTNIAPVAVSDSAATQNTAGVAIRVLTNDYAPGSSLNPASVAIASPPMNGKAFANCSAVTLGVCTTAAPGQVTYVSTTPNFVGSDSFSYTVNNTLPTPLTSNAATVTVQVTAPSGLIANPDTATTTGTNAVTISVLNNDVNSFGVTGSGAGLTVNAVVQPAVGQGTVTTNGTTVTYTPPPGGFAGTQSVTFQYQARDTVTAKLSNLATVTVSDQEPTLTSIAPVSGFTGSSFPVTLTGSNLTGATLVNVSGTGVTASIVTVTGTKITATFTITSAAATGLRTVSVTTPVGTSNVVNLSVANPIPPVLTSIAPNTGVRGTSVAVTLTGANLLSLITNGVTVAGGGVTVSGVTVVNDTTITATFTVTTSANATARNVSVTTLGGTSGNVTFTVQGPALTAISPNTGARGTTVAVTLTGANLSRATGMTVAGGGVTVNNFTVVSGTTVTANLTIATNAGISARTVTLSTPIGNVTETFTVINPPPPTLASVTPASRTRPASGSTIVPVTLTGTNFTTTGTTVVVSGLNVAVGAITVVNPTKITTTFTISSNAATGARNVHVTTPGGTSSTVQFTVN